MRSGILEAEYMLFELCEEASTSSVDDEAPFTDVRGQLHSIHG